MRRRSLFPALLLLLSATPVLADAVPDALKNRTVTIGWTANNTLRAESGNVISRSVQVRRQIYISSAGRTFVRFEANSGPMSRTKEFGPGESAGGRARELRFSGGKLVGSTEFASGAAQLVISFDAGYSGCSVDVTFGRSGGAPIRRRGLNGVMYELLKSEISGRTCGIRDGNVFAR